MKWSEALTKNRIAPEALQLEEPHSPAEAEQLKDLAFYTQGVFEKPERIEKIRELLRKRRRDKSTAPRIRTVIDAVLAELKEIAEDLAFAASRRGTFVLFVQDWAQTFHAALRRNKDFDNLFIGAHAEKETIVAQGSVPSAKALGACAALIEKHHPGVPVEFHVRLDPQK